jgi:predicted nucleotidyltransferase
MITEERLSEVRNLLARLREWAKARPDVVAVGVAGSWVHGDARMDSDVDVALLTEDRRPYLEGEAWMYDLGGVKLVKTRQWGPMTERRFALPSGLEVEMGVAPPSWAATYPVDEGTRRVITDGLSVVYNLEGLLAMLIDACGRG